MRCTLGCSVLLLLVATSPVPAQTRSLEDTGCDEVSSDRPYYCEVREETLAAGNPLDVDASPNGGIQVRGGNRNDVLLRARVVGYADTEDEARRVASQVRIETGGGQIRARGPERLRDTYWNVTFEVTVPQGSALALNTVNGGILVRDLQGTVTFKAVNGGVRLENVGGDVRGETTNGGLRIDLRGERWNGTGLDVETHNGGIHLTIPSNYSAELETGTSNGGLRIDFPVLVEGRVDRRITATLGSGGPRIRAMTRNGGVSVRKR